MKNITKGSFLKKIVAILCIILVMAFTVPQRVLAADDDWGIMGTLLKEIVKLIASVGDVGMAGLNTFMLGADGFTSAMISKDDQNLNEGSGSWLVEGLDDANTPKVTFEEDEINASFLGMGDGYQVPNMLFSPENIFANNIAALDVNFLHPNQYTSVIEGDDKADAASQSAAEDLREVISSWYISFRNIAIVGLLSVLIYLGIRIILSSTADDKAKYKESIKNWLVALCLVFIIHFIMSAILMLTDRATDLFATSVDNGFIVDVEGQNGKTFKTNLTGLIRFQVQKSSAQEATAYTIMYMVLVFYTFRFTFMYFKRFLYTAFFTMIAPLVALTYPIDKAGDGKSQAFNMWFKEYTMNVIIQPVHLILYTVFVGSAMDLVEKNPIYAIVAIGFLIPAEKFIKKMFGLDKAESTDGFGSFAGGAIAMQALNSAKGLIGKGGGSGKASVGNSSSNSDGDQTKIRTPNRPQLGSFSNGNYSRSSEDDGSDTARTQVLPQNEGELSEEEEKRRAEAVTNYLGDGYSQNANGEYYNPNTNSFDTNYKPWEDQAYGGISPATTNGEIDEGLEPTQPLRVLETPEAHNLRELVAREGLKGAGKRVGKLSITGAKTLGKGLYRGAKKVAPYAVGGTLGAVGAGIGLASGIATGQPSNAFRNMLTGAGVGAGIGANVPRLAGSAVNIGKEAINEVSTKTDKARYTKDEILYGRDYARQQQIMRGNKKLRDEFLKNRDEQEKYSEMMGKLGYKGNRKDFMNAAFDLKEAGVKSDDMLENALGLEMKRDGGEVGGKSHENVMDVASFAEKNGYGKDYIEDAKKRESMEGVVQSIVPGQDAQMAVMDTFASLYKRENYYRKHSGIKPQNSNSANDTSNNTLPTQTRRKGRPSGSTSTRNQNQ